MRYRHAPGVFFEWIDGELVVCEQASGDVYALSGTGAEIYELCADDSAEAVVSELAKRYPDETRTSLATHCDLFTRKLAAARLLVLEDATMQPAATEPRRKEAPWPQ